MEIDVYEAKHRLAELINRFHCAEELVITRRGKAVVRLALPDDHTAERRSAVAAIARLKQASEGVSLGNLKSRDLIQEGRRLCP